LFSVQGSNDFILYCIDDFATMFGGSKGLDDAVFQLRFTTKQMERLAAKAEKDMKAQKAKVKKALQQGNVDGARIYAENAIRKKNEGLNYLRFASKLDAVQARVQTATTMKNIARSIGSVVTALDRAMASMDLEKVSKVMDKFEKEFEDLDVRTSMMENSMSTATTTTAPVEQIDALIKQVADENGLDVAAAMPAAVSSGIGEESRVKEEDSLTARLAALRQ